MVVMEPRPFFFFFFFSFLEVNLFIFHFIFFICPNQYTINRFSTFYTYIVGRRSQQVFANFSLGDPLFLNIFYCYIIIIVIYVPN